MLRTRHVVAVLFTLAAGCASSSPDPTSQPITCGPGTTSINGVCVLNFTPPPGKQLGTGATIYVWETASAGATAQGKVYVMVNGSTQGTITGYASSGNPTCGTNEIAAVSVSVAPGQSYSITAHDQYSSSWPAFQTPTITSGECYSFALN